MLDLDFEPFVLSFKLAALVTIILFIIAIPVSWWLSSTKCRCKPFVEAVVSLPIVLPRQSWVFISFLHSLITPR
jgi:molybdate transport system permease protein